MYKYTIENAEAAPNFPEKNHFEFKPTHFVNLPVTFQYFMKSQKINSNKTLVNCRRMSKLYTRLKTEYAFNKAENM